MYSGIEQKISISLPLSHTRAHPGRRTSRIVGREQFVAFGLLAVVLTTASVGLKRFGTAAEVISSEQKCNYVSRHGLKGAGSARMQRRPPVEWIGPSFSLAAEDGGRGPNQTDGSLLPFRVLV